MIAVIGAVWLFDRDAPLEPPEANTQTAIEPASSPEPAVEDDAESGTVITSVTSEIVSAGRAIQTRTTVEVENREARREREREQRADDRPPAWLNFEASTEQFESEARDEAWAEQTEVDLLASLSLIPDLGLVNVEVECRQSLCRLGLLFPRGAEIAYALRRVYALSGDIGLEPLSSESGEEPGRLPLLKIFLRRTAA